MSKKTGFNHQKTTQALNFFASQEGVPIVKMKALKLLWLADRLHMRRYGRSVSDDTYYAMRLGPVASGARNIMAHNTSFLNEAALAYSQQFVAETTHRKFKSIAPVDEKMFSETDREVLNAVYQEFGKLSEDALSELSHFYPEWIAFEEQLAEHPESRYLMSYDDFFRNAAEQKNHALFNQEKELLELSHELFGQA